MKRFLVVALLGVGLVFQAAAAENEGGGQLILSAGDAITFGGLKVKDVTIDVETEVFNPRLGAEYKFGGTAFAIGAEYAMSENSYTGEYSDNDSNGNGSFDVKRSDLGLYVRFGSRDNVNFKLGYRYFNFEFSNGELDQYENGILTEEDRNGEATGDLTTGIDGELNLALGDELQFALALGGSYFIDANYEWSYDKKGEDTGGAWQHVEGSATYDAYSARIRPEISFEPVDNLRIYLNYTLQASMWSADVDTDDFGDYPGLDLYSAVECGARLTIGM
jgi:hypothetical protein